VPASGVICDNDKVLEWVSTSYPEGDWWTEKNCSRQNRKNPTQCSGVLCRISDYCGEIFLHFSMSILWLKILTMQRKYFFQLQGTFLC